MCRDASGHGRGPPGLALRALALERPARFTPVWSTAIVAETWRTLTLRAERAGQTGAAVSRAAHALWCLLDPVFQVAEASTPPAGGPLSPLRDPHDAHLWHAALNAGAQYVVSHNTRDFPPIVFVVAQIGGAECPVGRHVHAGIEFLTAIEFIEDVLGADAASPYGAVSPSVALYWQSRGWSARDQVADGVTAPYAPRTAASSRVPRTSSRSRSSPSAISSLKATSPTLARTGRRQRALPHRTGQQCATRHPRREHDDGCERGAGNIQGQVAGTTRTCAL